MHLSPALVFPLSFGHLDPSHLIIFPLSRIAEGVGISKRLANVLAGHNRKRDASDGYVAIPVNVLKATVDLFPATISRVGPQPTSIDALTDETFGDRPYSS